MTWFITTKWQVTSRLSPSRKEGKTCRGPRACHFGKRKKKKEEKKSFFFPFFFFKDFVALYFYNTRNTRTMEIKEGGGYKRHPPFSLKVLQV
jgi:hypothetical protein